jgi:hypothetical protein
LNAALEVVGDDIRTFVRAGQENDTFTERHRTFVNFLASNQAA